MPTRLEKHHHYSRDDFLEEGDCTNLIAVMPLANGPQTLQKGVRVLSVDGYHFFEASFTLQNEKRAILNFPRITHPWYPTIRSTDC